MSLLDGLIFKEIYTTTPQGLYYYVVGKYPLGWHLNPCPLDYYTNTSPPKAGGFVFIYFVKFVNQKIRISFPTRQRAEKVWFHTKTLIMGQIRKKKQIFYQKRAQY